MSKCTRREWIAGNLAALAGVVSADPGMARASTEGARSPGSSTQGMKLALMLPAGEPVRCRIARQIGVRHAIVPVSRVLKQITRDKYLERLARIKAEFEEAGLRISGVESHPVDAHRIKLGLPGRDEEIANYRAAIEALGKVDIPMVCYNFMAGIGWYRTRVDVPERGGALTSEFDAGVARRQPLTEYGQVSEEKVWDSITYFLRRIIPVAENAGVKMALHPDDPPVSPLRGIGRILTSGDAFRRVLEIAPSPSNGITFCQANFKAMGEDLEALIHEFGGRRKIFFAHFRDIRGTGERFQETFHDNGPTDMPRILEAYHRVGFDGPIRPDHAPTLEGESNDSPGYAMQGKIFAVGYMKGVLEASKIPCQ